MRHDPDVHLLRTLPLLGPSSTDRDQETGRPARPVRQRVPADVGSG